MDLEIIRVRDLLAARLVFDGIDRMEGKSGDICECFRQREFPAAGITEHRNPIHITTCESALLPRCFTLSLPRKQGARRLTARNARDTWMWTHGSEYHHVIDKIRPVLLHKKHLGNELSSCLREPLLP